MSNPLLLTSGIGVQTAGGLLPGQPGWLDPNAGWTAQALGHLAARDWLSGGVPLWNPYSGIGLPLAANAQAGALFLPFVLLYWFADGAILVKITLQIVAGLATYALLRELGLGRLGATLGAGLFCLCGFYAWYSAASLRPIGFLPLILLGVEYSRRPAGFKGRGGWLLIAVGFAYSLYAGFPEVAYVNGLLVAAWFTYRAVRARPRGSVLVLRVTLGIVAGLLLATPELLLFVQFLQHSIAEGHNTSIGSVGLSADSLPLLLFPYIFGPLAGLVGADPSALFVIWGRIGGYLGFTVAVLAVLALKPGGRDAGLRWVLAAWIVLAIAKSWNVAPVSYLLNQVPLVDRIGWFRYATPSWEFAASLLAAFAVDDRVRGDPRSRHAVLATLAGVLLVALVFLWSGRSVLETLQHNYASYVHHYFLTSLAVTALVALLVVCLYLVRSTRAAPILLAAALLGSSAALFMLPLFSGPRQAHLDRGPVAFLATHLGRHRFYTIGPIQPNYGAYFRLESLNYVYLPVVRAWATIVRRHLDPKTDISYFIPSVRLSLSEASPAAQAAALRTRVPAYEALGVKYVLTPNGEDPFIREIRPVVGNSNRPQPLLHGQQLTGAIPGGLVSRGSIASVAVLIGTYRGGATGTLRISLCQAGRCQSGEASLATAADNSLAEVRLARPLYVSAKGTVTYSIKHIGGNSPVAVWLGSVAKGSQLQGLLAPSGPKPHLAPHLVLQYTGSRDAPRLVYRDSLVDIFQLSEPAPYFQAPGGTCKLRVRSQTRLTATCLRGTRLVRNELAYPGWTATVSGRQVPISATGMGQQSLTLPKGRSVVKFAYAPAFLWLSLLALALGLTALVVGVVYLWRRRGADFTAQHHP